MVNQSQLDAVQKLVQTSRHLSNTERDEWLSLLPFMSDKQLSDFSSILQTQLPVLEQHQESNTLTGSRKELPAGEPELDLPQPAPLVIDTEPQPALTQLSKPPAPVEVQVAGGANLVSDFINRNFAATLHRTAVAPSMVTPPPTPALQESQPNSVGLPVQGAGDTIAGFPSGPPPKKILQSAQVNNLGAYPFAEASEGVRELQSADQHEPVFEEVVQTPKSLEDVRRLNAATLRGRGALTLENELKILCKKFGYFSVLFALENSPLYQTYTAVGARVLQDGQSFERAQESLAKDNRPYLTKPEFEEVNDLLQRIKSA